MSPAAPQARSDQSDGRVRCGAPTAAGGACAAFASLATGRCSRHDAARQQEPRALALVRRGLRRDDPMTIKRAVGAAIEDVLAHRLSNKDGQAVAALVRAWLQAHDRHVLEREVAELRDLAARAQAPDAVRRADASPVTEEDLVLPPAPPPRPGG